MPNPTLVVAGISGASSILSSRKSASATQDAATAQVEAADLGIDEQRRQFEAVQEMLSPFINKGNRAMQRMANIAGINGQRKQARVMDQIGQDPRLQYAIESGEEALLAGASATGGLRGGNTQAALAELRPALTAGFIDQTYGQLGQLAGMGQASAAGQAAAAQSTGANVTQLLGQQGAALAGGALGGANAFNQGLGGVGQAAGFLLSNAGQAPEGAGLFDRWGF